MYHFLSFGGCDIKSNDEEKIRILQSTHNQIAGISKFSRTEMSSAAITTAKAPRNMQL